MFCIFVAGLNKFLHTLDFSLNQFQVFYLKFQIEDFFVAYGIYRSFYMREVGIVETSQYVNQCICLAYVGQKRVSNTFAPAGTFCKPRYIHDFDSSRNYFRSFDNFIQIVKSFIRYRNDADIGFVGTESIVGNQRF